MTKVVGQMFNFSDRLQMETLNQRLLRNSVISSNIANAETPGFRALGYDFEEQLQAAASANEPIPMLTSAGKHLKNRFTEADGKAYPDVFVRPSESITNDGNTVDIDKEMGMSAKNQILYRSAVELINRKIGTIRYAITSGGR